MSNIAKLDAASLREKLARLKASRDALPVVQEEKPAPAAAKLTEVDNNMAEVLQRIGDLEIALKEEIPTLPHILVEIHKMLAGQDDIVHLLSDEQRAVIVSACWKHSGTEIITGNRKAGKTSDGTKKLKSVGVGDI